MPPPILKASTLMPSVRSRMAPPVAKKMQTSAAMMQALIAMARRHFGSARSVSAANTGMVPMGSTTSSSTTKNLASVPNTWVPLQPGTSASTRSGLPDPFSIFNGGQMMIAPVGGS